MDELTAGPRPYQNLFRLFQALLRLVVINTETLVIINVVGRAAAEPDNEAPLGDVVEDRQLLGEADRVMQRRLYDRKADFAAPGRAGVQPLMISLVNSGTKSAP